MDIQERLKEILDKKGWTRYRLAKESDVPEPTLTSIFFRGSVPTISTLDSLCKAMGISLSQFFADGEMIELTPELKEFYEAWMYLTPEKRNTILETMKMMK